MRAQDLGQADGLAPRVGQLQRHVVLAGDGLDHADAHQRQRARQVLGQVDHLRALDAGGRLDLVARDHRAGAGRDDPHLDAEVLELLLDQPAGHLQRLGSHRLHPRRRGVEQVDLRQLGVGQLHEQRLLPLLGHALGLGHLQQRRLDHQRQVVHHLLALDLDLVLAVDECPLADAAVLGLFLLLLTAFAKAIDGGADDFSQRQPRETQRQRHAGHQRSDPQHARTGETEPVRRQRPQREAEHATCMAGKLRLPLVKAGPFQRAAGGHQQREAGPEGGTRQQWCGQRGIVLAANGLCQAGQPGAQADRDEPPHRIAEQEQAQVGHPRADHAGLVAQRLAVARGGKARIAEVVGGQRQQQQQPGHGTDDHPSLLPPASGWRGRHRDGQAGLGCGLARVGVARCGAFSAQGTERKCHGHDCGRSGRHSRRPKGLFNRSAGVP